MYVKQVSLSNFGPFSKANFEFSGAAINVVVGANATGKTQLCGAILLRLWGDLLFKSAKVPLGHQRFQSH